MKSFVKKLLVVALTAPTFAFAQVSLDKVVATVAGEPITTQEIQDRITINMMVINTEARKQVNLTKEQIKNLNENSFAEVIEEHVLLNQAKKVGINISDAEVDQNVANFAKNQNMSTEEFKKYVITKGGGERAWMVFLRDLKSDMITNKLVTQEVSSKVKVTPDEIDAFLAERKMGANNPTPKNDYVEALHIFVPKNNVASLKKIQAAKAEINKGKTFEEVGAQFSDAQVSASAPIVVALEDPQADANVRAALKATPDGAVSDVVKTNAGVHLFKVLSHKTQEVTLDQQKVFATQALTAKKTQEDYKAWHSNVIEYAKKNLIEYKK